MYIHTEQPLTALNAHQVETNQKCIECASIMFTLFFEIRGQCASYVLMVTQLLRVTKWPTLALAVLAVLLLFNWVWLRLKYEQDRRRLRLTRPTR